MPPELLVIGVPLVVIVAGVVQGAKHLGLDSKYAGLASIGAAAVVVGLVELQTDPAYGGWATWALFSLVYGLASSGLYSQVKKLTEGP